MIRFTYLCDFYTYHVWNDIKLFRCPHTVNTSQTCVRKTNPIPIGLLAEWILMLAFQYPGIWAGNVVTGLFNLCGTFLTESWEIFPVTHADGEWAPHVCGQRSHGPCAHTYAHTLTHTLQWPTDGRCFPEPGLLCRVSEGFKLPLKIDTELNCVQPAGTGSHFLSGFNTPLGLYGLCTVEMNKLH